MTKEDTYHHKNLKEELIEAGITLVAKEGLEGFSLRKVAAVCGVSHTAPYSHFENKDVLLEEMQNYITNGFSEELKKAIGYCRVSTQAQDEKFGMEAQKEEIRRYARENGYRIVQWCEDVVSGVSDDKDALNKILYGVDVANPPFEAVIVFKSDRVSRDIKQYFYLPITFFIYLL